MRLVYVESLPSPAFIDGKLEIPTTRYMPCHNMATVETLYRKYVNNLDDFMQAATTYGGEAAPYFLVVQ